MPLLKFKILAIVIAFVIGFIVGSLCEYKRIFLEDAKKTFLNYTYDQIRGDDPISKYLSKDGNLNSYPAAGK